MVRQIFVLIFLGVICASDDFAITGEADIDCCSGNDECEAHQYYELCLKAKQQCTRIHYAKTDVSKGLDCRNACAVGPATKSKNISAFYCPSEENAACNKYHITGRAGHAENFARHVKCVLACELVNSVIEENSAHVRLCGCAAQTCTNFYPWDNTFSSFKDCWQDCSGWTNSDKTVLALAYVCNSHRRCQSFYHYNEPEKTDSLQNLIQCVDKCERDKGLRYKCDQEVYSCVPLFAGVQETLRQWRQ
ncbi:hypothetical protein SprV_0301383800 [Sparganum proliferum]